MNFREVVFQDVEFFVIVPWSHIPEGLTVGTASQAAPEDRIAHIRSEELT